MAITHFQTATRSAFTRCCKVLGTQTRCVAAAAMAAPTPNAMSQNSNGDESILAAKKDARKAVRTALKQMSPEQMATESKAVCDGILQTRFFQTAKQLGVYLHCSRLLEVDTTQLVSEALAQGKRCFVPLVQDKASNMQLLHLDDMSALTSVPPFGILEPSPTYADGSPRQDALTDHQALDVLLMPGLGFDTQGRRLGRGGGYYDKAVARLKAIAQELGHPPPLLVALAFSAQVVESIPTLPHDEVVDVLVTASGRHGCTPAGRAALSSSS